LGDGFPGLITVLEMLDRARTWLAVAPGQARSEAQFKAQLAQLYRDHYEFVWSSLRRLGLRESAVDDAVQEVFLVVYRRLPEYEGSAGHRAWLFAIALRIAREARRRDARLWLEEPVAAVAATAHPDEGAALRQRVQLLDTLLGALNDEQREVFVMAEVEGFNAPEIAQALGVKLNTVYSRLRLGRVRFERALARHQAACAKEASR
jgi:RNA polymerase sigma-70 factor (ECF subfamily)